MRIAYISASRIPSRTANSVHVMKMCQALSDNSCEVLLLAQGNPHSDKSELFAHYGVRGTFDLRLIDRPNVMRGGPLAYLTGVRRTLANLPPFDLIYGRHLFALNVLPERREKIVAEFHAAPVTIPERVATWQLARDHRLAKAVVISSKLGEDLIEFAPSLRHRILIAPDAADPLPENVAPLESWPGRESTLQVGYVGSFYEGRGLELIIRSAESLPTVDFHLIGGKAGDGITANLHSIPPNVHFHGYLSQPELPGIYAHLNALLAPYQNKVGIGKRGRDTSKWMSPLKLFEYMAAGKAIITSDLPAIREFLDDKTAIFCDPSNPAAWKDAIYKLEKDPKLAQTIGNAAKLEFTSKYTWRRRAQEILKSLGSNGG